MSNAEYLEENVIAPLERRVAELEDRLRACYCLAERHWQDAGSNEEVDAKEHRRDIAAVIGDAGGAVTNSANSSFDVYSSEVGRAIEVIRKAGISW